MKNADSRPRVHLWPRQDGYWDRSRGPTETRYMASGAGLALDVALAELGDRARQGVVVIIEPQV